MKKVTKFSIASVIATSLLVPTSVFAFDSESYINQINSIDFKSKMSNTSEESLNNYFNSYSEDAKNVDSQYQSNFDDISSNLKGQSIIYQDEKGNLQFEFATNDKDFNQKYEKLKTQMNSNIDKKIVTEENNYDKKDAINQKLYEAEKKSNNSTHKSKFLSYKSSATANMNKNYKNYAGQFNSAKAGLSGKYNPSAFAMSVGDLESRVQGNSGYQAANNAFNSFGADIKSGLKSKIAKGFADYANNQKEGAEGAVNNQERSYAGAQKSAVPLKGDIKSDLDKVHKYTEEIFAGDREEIPYDKLQKELGLKNSPDELADVIARNRFAADIAAKDGEINEYLPEEMRQFAPHNPIISKGEEIAVEQYLTPYNQGKSQFTKQIDKMIKAGESGKCGVAAESSVECQMYRGENGYDKVIAMGMDNYGLDGDFIEERKEVLEDKAWYKPWTWGK